MANLEEIKKLADEEGVELTEEMLEAVAGGLYSEQEWAKMNKNQRRAAIIQSQQIKASNSGEYCKYFDPDPVV